MDRPAPSTRAKAAARALEAAQWEEGEEQSSAQGRRAAKEGKGDEEDSDKGDSEDEDDSEYDKNGNEKKPVYHWQIWRKLLRKGSMRRKGSKEGLLRYVNREPQSGNHPLDITAVYGPQMHWDMENRSFWPANLKLWQRPDPWVNPTYDVGVMKYKGHVVLDYKGDPIQNFRIPLTISSNIGGLRIESWIRSDKRLSLEDIEARMWTKDTPVEEDTPLGKAPAFNKRTLSKRASLARIKAGLVIWETKKGREAQTAMMHSLRTPQQRANNLATDQDLTPQQRGTYAKIGLNENRQSNAPTRAERIRKIKKAAARGDTATGTGAGEAAAGPSDPVAASSSEGDNQMDTDSDTDSDDEAELETQVQEQASADVPDDESSASSSLIDPLDSRHDQPANPEEEALLERALEITVEDFLSQTGQQPGPTNPGDNYFSQWGMLQAQLRTLWRASRNTGEALPVPRLRARDRWTGGISQFEVAEETEAGWYTESESE